MMIAGVFEWPAAVLAWLYELTGDYAVAIGLIAVIVMALVTIGTVLGFQFDRIKDIAHTGN